MTLGRSDISPASVCIDDRIIGLTSGGIQAVRR
jgi:hypothetical protein